MAQGSPAGYDQLDAATKATDLVSAAKPWHLKLQIELFDTKGNLSSQGTIERWQSGEDSRTTTSFGSSGSVEVEHGGQAYRETRGEPLPQPAAALLRAVLHPGPYAADLAKTTPSLQTKSMGKVQMNCIMLSRPLSRNKPTPLGVFPTYCLSQAGHLDVLYNFGSDLIVRNKVGTFQGLDVTVDGAVLQGTRLIAQSKLIELGTYEPTAEQFEPTAEMRATALFATVSGAVVAGRKLSGDQPIYPVSARQDRISGTVVLRATIGADGRIRSLVPVSGPDPDLVIASLAAVRTWEYKPYLLNGVPTDVSTDITVNFNIR